MRTFMIALVLTIGTTLAVGCGAVKPAPGDGRALAALETRVTKLESDLHAAEVARDAATAKVRALELANRDLTAKYVALTATNAATAHDRDETRVQLTAQTAEKEQLAGHLDQFRKNLRELLGQVDSVAGSKAVTGLPVSLSR